MSAPRHIPLLLLLAPLLLTACTPDDGPVNGGTSAVTSSAVPSAALHPLRLTATSGDIAATRAADGLYTSATGFDGDETVRLFLHNSSAPTIIPSAYYAVGTPDDSHKSALTASWGDELYYPVEQTNSGSPVFTLYGVYPIWSTAEHTVSYDQRGNESYKRSDLMYASTPLTWTSAADKDNARNLQFNHQLCKLKLTVVKGAGVHEMNHVRMVGVKRRVAVSPAPTGIGLGTAETTLDAYGDEILLFVGEETTEGEQTYQYCCIFPPQTWTAAAFIAIDADGGTATFQTTKTFEAGREYSLTITLDNVESSFTATVDDWPEGEQLPEETFIF